MPAVRGRQKLALNIRIDMKLQSVQTLFYEELSLGFSCTHIARILKLETVPSAVERVMLMSFERK